MSGSCEIDDVDDSAILPGLSVVRRILKDELLSLKGTLLGRIDDGNKCIQEMRSELDIVMRNLRATRELVNSLALGTVSTMTGKKALNPTVAAQLQSADMFLRSEVISAVSISSISKYVGTFSDVWDEEQVLGVIRLLLFAPGANSRKKARKSDLGRKFVELRIKIIKNMVFNCQVAVRKECMSLMQPLLRFQDVPAITSDSNGSEKGGLVGATSHSEVDGGQQVLFRPPAWTGKGFIGREDVDSAVAELIKQEVEDEAGTLDGNDSPGDAGLVQTQVLKRRKTTSSTNRSTREEVSREIVKYMWKRWTDWFGNSRNEARKSFTLDLGVIFLEPQSRWKPMCSSNAVHNYLDMIDTVSVTEVNSVFRTNYEASTSNMELFEAMKNEFPNFVVTYQHTVEVFERPEEMAQNQGGHDMTLRRSVNLIQVAANFLTAYFQASSLEAFLGGSRSSLRVVFIVALAFSDIVSRASRPRVGSNGRDRVCSEAKELGLLIPGDAGRINFITEKCLRMSKETFDSLCSESSDQLASGNGSAPRGEICSDDEDVQNIFA